MGRKPTPVVDVTPTAVVNDAAVKAGTEALNELSAFQRETTAAVVEIARRMEYQGSLNPDDLEAGLKADKEEMGSLLFRAGTRFLLLKEQCPHGEFIERIGRAGYQPREAQRAMQAVLAFSSSNASTSTHLNSQKIQGFSKSKVVELFALEDKEIKELKENGSVRGITLDEMDRMSVSELRAKLKKAEESIEAAKVESAATLQAKDQLLASVRERANAAEEKLAKYEAGIVPADERLDDVTSDITSNGKKADDALRVVELLVESIDAIVTDIFDQGGDRAGAVALVQRTRDQVWRLASTVGRIQAAFDTRLQAVIDGLEQFVPYTEEEPR